MSDQFVPTIQTLNLDRGSAKCKTIVVLGVGRGGTSATAGVLRELGVEMPNAHPLKHEWSPLAFEENGNIDLNSTIAVIDEINKRHDNWGWKSPRDCFFLDQFQCHLRNPIVVIVFRNLLDTCLSASRHSVYPWEIAVEENATVLARLARTCLFSALPIVAVSYETILSRRIDFVHELNDALGLKASKEMCGAAASFVEANKYNKVSFDRHGGEFSGDELLIDAYEAQISLFTSINASLDNQTRALRADLANARFIASNIESTIASQIATGTIESLSSRAKNTIKSDFQEPATARKANEHDISRAKQLADIYKEKRLEYNLVVDERIKAQQRLDVLDLYLSRLMV